MLFLLIIGQGCAYSIHQVHVSDFSPYEKLTSGQIVKAQDEQFVILGFAMDTNYVETTREKLISQCPKGDLQGITTRYSTDLGFFSWTNKILMQAVCLVN